MRLRSSLRWTLFGLVAWCGCSSPSPTPVRQTPPPTEASNTPPNPSSTPAASAAPSAIAAPPVTSAATRPPAAVPPGKLPTSAAPSFSVQCIEPSTGRTNQPPRACILRGRIRAVKRLDTLPDANWLFDGFSPAVAHQAFDVDITPDNGISCPTPLDAKAKDRLPEADFPDLAMAGRVRILGGERIASELVANARICGWSRFVARPGLNYPTGWEGELSAGNAKNSAWKLLGAYSMYVNATSNPHLWRSWSFIREGAARRIPIDEGGAFIAHDAVKIQHNKQSAVSQNGEEVSLKASDGTFAVLAISDLTAGNVPVFVGQHDGFTFSAVRVEP